MVLRNFLFKYPLSVGAYSVGGLFCLIHLGCVIATIIQVVTLQNEVKINEFPWAGAYSISITVVIFSFLLLGITLWFLYGIWKRKASVVLTWYVITIVWLVSASCKLLVVLIILAIQTNVATWVIAVVCSIVGLCIIIYSLMVVGAFWKELKNPPSEETS